MPQALSAWTILVLAALPCLAAPVGNLPRGVRHWAFLAPVRPPLPRVSESMAARNTIDVFIQARLVKEGLRPSPEADRITLIRRVTLDLLGLPPAPADVAAFVNDSEPAAYERVVERLLASPHYGERWGRHWLDLSRYADSNGYSIDAPRSIWKYRDWVVDALNADMPLDQFVIEQLAGDLLPDATIEQKIATGFHRNTQINQEGGIDPEQFRIESVLDRVNTTGTALLGLTIGCAQCHDHKFDPITQKEYYELFAFFNNTVDDGHGQGTPGGILEIPRQFENMDHLEKELAEAEADLERYLNTHGNAVRLWEQGLSETDREKLPPLVRRALGTSWDQRSPSEKRMAYASFRREDPEFASRQKKLSRLEKREPKSVTTLVMQELPKSRSSYVFVKGDFTRRGEAVSPGVPAVLHPLPEVTKGETPLTRLDLAQWLVAPENPLTARVIVNRIWQQYFGRGLVETENDFGTQGTEPSHPELLDWLALEMRAGSWSLKSMHRLIVSSATYRQSSQVAPGQSALDPANKWLARQSRLRLDAEMIRDVALMASGVLSPTMGGPSVFPPQPDGVMRLGQLKREWTPSTGADRYRRGFYTFLWRATPHPALAIFDAPDAFSACTRRLRSNTPLQALTLLNDEAFVECARVLARAVVSEPAPSDQARMENVFARCLGRKPLGEEQVRLLHLLDAEATTLAQTPKEAAALAGQAQEHPEIIRLAAWTSVCRVLLNLDETITRE